MPGVWPEPWPVEEPANEEAILQAYLDALPPHEFQRLLESFEEMGPLPGLDAASFDIPPDAAEFEAFENQANTDPELEVTQGSSTSA
ncbi:hypothetical protein EXIGLDRAFT_725356 [Exidia glandulosa HHB12029]|uniref:Uncharacterized protein n=1 Tax=Exidia glandulosa HHB12029 TaxID=1314781 RepID=A0A166BAG2_EXIGL|nr:hypothetical protein EXIGLDRAFT_725356 [Exidia glandulosa HHB12029]